MPDDNVVSLSEALVERETERIRRLADSFIDHADRLLSSGADYEAVTQGMLIATAYVALRGGADRDEIVRSVNASFPAMVDILARRVK